MLEWSSMYPDVWSDGVGLFVPEAQQNFKIESPWNSIFYILGLCFILFSQIIIIVSYSSKAAILVLTVFCLKTYQQVHFAFFVKLLFNFTLQLWNSVQIIQIMTCFLHNDRFCYSENECFLSIFFNQQTIALVTLKQCTWVLLFFFFF